MIKSYLSRKKWRKINSHNSTEMGRLFPVDLVKVGAYTYGTINLIAYDVNNKKDRLEMGNFISISGNVTFLLCEQHQSKTAIPFPLKSILAKNQYPEDAMSRGSIVIEDEVWIGYGVTILSGVRVGKGSVIATGAVVTKDVAPYSIIGGVPAKLIKKRFSDDIINKLSSMNFIDLPIDVITDNIELFYKEIKDSNDINEIENLFKKYSK